MTFVPDECINGKTGLNLAPMIDFLFLMLIFFASIAVSRAAVKETQIDLVEIRQDPSTPCNPSKPFLKDIHININAKGEYVWSTEVHDYPMQTPEEIKEELCKQYDRGLISQEKSHTKVLLNIDRQAPWEAILPVIFSIREIGFETYPIYEPERHMISSTKASDPLPK